MGSALPRPFVFCSWWHPPACLRSTASFCKSLKMVAAPYFCVTVFECMHTFLLAPVRTPTSSCCTVLLRHCFPVECMHTFLLSPVRTPTSSCSPQAFFPLRFGDSGLCFCWSRGAPAGQNWPMAPLPAPLADTGLALPRQFADESPPPPSPTGSGRLSLFGTPPARDDGTALHSSQSWLRWRSGGRCLLPVRFRAGGVE